MKSNKETTAILFYFIGLVIFSCGLLMIFSE